MFVSLDDGRERSGGALRRPGANPTPSWVHGLLSAEIEEELRRSRDRDAVNGFLIGPDANAQLVFDLPGLRCSVASSPVLLAMKVLAHRVGDDEEDVLLLARHLGLSSSDAVLSVALEAYGDRLPAASHFFVEELFASEDGK